MTTDHNGQTDDSPSNEAPSAKSADYYYDEFISGTEYERYLDKLIADETGMPVNIADNPLDCVADGTGIYLESEMLKLIGKRV